MLGSMLNVQNQYTVQEKGQVTVYRRAQRRHVLRVTESLAFQKYSSTVQILDCRQHFDNYRVWEHGHDI